jgi:hypothetical protein
LDIFSKPCGRLMVKVATLGMVPSLRKKWAGLTAVRVAPSTVAR